MKNINEISYKSKCITKKYTVHNSKRCIVNTKKKTYTVVSLCHQKTVGTWFRKFCMTLVELKYYFNILTGYVYIHENPDYN